MWAVSGTFEAANLLVRENIDFFGYLVLNALLDITENIFIFLSERNSMLSTRYKQ